MNAPTQNLASFWQKNASLIGKALAGILFLFALYLVAKMVWLWVDYSQADNAIQANPQRVVSRAPVKVDPNKLATMHLFGRADQESAPVEEVVGETRLKLKLLGVYVDSEEKLSSAIIQSGGSSQKVYWLGDKIEARGQVSLRRVEPLKVIINNNGKNETLTLLEQLNQQVISSGKQTPKKAAANPDGRTIDKRRDSKLSQDLADMREKLSQSPQSYADLAKFEPVIGADGMVSGFKIGPGKDRRMFAQLGLRRNDVVTSVNGQGLNNEAYWTVLEQLQTAESLEISIERNGQPVTLLLNIGGQAQNTDPRPKPVNGNKLQ